MCFTVPHRSLITNKKLYQFSIKDSDDCEHCGNTDTITHLLYKCDRISHLWKELEHWLNTLMADPVILDETSVLIGNPGNELIVNYIYIITKHKVYKSKWNKTNIKILKIKRILRSHMELNIYLGMIKNCLPKMLSKCASIYNTLRYI